MDLIPKIPRGRDTTLSVLLVDGNDAAESLTGLSIFRMSIRASMTGSELLFLTGSVSGSNVNFNMTAIQTATLPLGKLIADIMVGDISNRFQTDPFYIDVIQPLADTLAEPGGS